MMNVFTTIPKFVELNSELKRFSRNEPAIRAAQAAGDVEEERRIILAGTGSFADAMADRLKMTIEVYGKENLPESGPVYIVSNHQSYADILMLFYAVRNFQIGFIAKSEFKKVKVLANMINLTRSLFIDRGDPRSAVQTMNEAADMMRNGFSLAIYPEGTRSRSHAMGEFKAGSFKPAQKAGVPILPVSVEGGYHVYEETGSYKPNTTAKLLFHPIVPYGEMTRKEQHAANLLIEETIRKGLDQLV
ncbi:MAG: 1-acyl-sn-glycerol-3-phosphate acyltransferase [Mogibacterium sp.]|nr:1-acyl-sn-glycerol-3-phosphate acyltransferase [Mogibacterium sp.]